VESESSTHFTSLAVSRLVHTTKREKFTGRCRIALRIIFMNRTFLQEHAEFSEVLMLQVYITNNFVFTCEYLQSWIDLY
jgi:hypothetical protein